MKNKTTIQGDFYGNKGDEVELQGVTMSCRTDSSGLALENMFVVTQNNNTFIFKGKRKRTDGLSFNINGVVSRHKVKDGIRETHLKNWKIENMNELRKPKISDSDFVVDDGILKEYIGWRLVTDEIIAAIPSSVKRIGKCVFINCRKLKNVAIPDGITHTGAEAFAGCSNMKSMTLPDSVTHIEKFSFAACEKLENVFIPGSVTHIENDAFNECSSLAEIHIPDSVIQIGHGAFQYCYKLKNITLPKNIKNTDMKILFRNCWNL